MEENLFEIDIFSLQHDKKKEIKNAVSCSLNSLEDGQICILNGHENLQGTISQNSILKIVRREQTNTNHELVLHVANGIFSIKDKHISIFCDEKT